MNAADPGQIDITKRQERRRVEQTRADLRAIVSMPEGRRMLAWLFEHLKPEGNLWSPNAAITGFNAARSDVAIFIEDCIDEVDPDARLLMLQEKRQREKQNAAELAAHVAGRSAKTEKKTPDNETESGWE